MLKKLIKHELNDTLRLFLPICLLIIVLTPLFAFLMRLGLDDYSYVDSRGWDISYSLHGGLIGYYLLIMGLFLGCQIMLALRFYRTTSTNEAYLTFTLPTTPGKILFSKWLIAMLYYIVSGVLALGSILFTIVVATPATFHDMIELIQELMMEMDISGFSLLVLITLTFIASGAATILQFYAAIMLGQLFRSHRIIISIGFYIAMTVVIRIIGAMVILPIVFSFFSISSGINDSPYFLHYFFLMVVLAFSFVAGGFYLMTYLIMQKKLNVQ